MKSPRRMSWFRIVDVSFNRVPNGPRASRRPRARGPLGTRLNEEIRVALVFFALAGGSCAAQDVIEFLSGARAEGKVTQIDKTNKQVAFDTKIGDTTLQRVYPYDKIHAVTFQGTRYVLNEKTADTTTRPATVPGNPSPAEPVRPSGRTTTDIKAAIDQAGRTAPDWYASTPLDYPQALDLTWPEKAPPGWNNQKNVGQYVWDIINPNESRWRSGVRLMHHLLALHKDDPSLRQRVMESLGGMYFRFFQDYARAAFWWQQAGVSKGSGDSIGLAECYWRLGNRSMAEAMILDPDRDRGGSLLVGMIKLWGDMGEPEKAVKMAEWYVRVGGPPHLAYLLAGDACRLAARYQDAVRYYQKVIATPVTSTQGKVDQTIARAKTNMEAVQLFELTDVSKVADGTYRASSAAYEGPLEVEVTVQSGRIQAVRVTKHTEKQYYSALRDVPQQIIQKQGVKGVDTTSRATITAEAVINATAKALASGAK